MMKTVGISEVKARFSKLIADGEVVTITKRGRPVATLAPVRQSAASAVVRIRELHCIHATTDEIVTLVREGRR